MDNPLTVDLISDLKITSSDEFDWTDKPTSLFCVIAGGLSDSPKIIKRTLEHLGTLYRGVLYIDGSYEHLELSRYDSRTAEIASICERMKNVIYMHNHTVLLNGVAFVAINGWFENSTNIYDPSDVILFRQLCTEDLDYLCKSITNLQNHPDVKKIVVISNSIPSEFLLYGRKVNYSEKSLEPGLALLMDNQHKVTHWLYGGSEIVADTNILSRRFVNNPRLDSQPYWPKQIII